MTFQTIIDRLLFAAIVLLALTLPFSIALSQISLGLAVLFWLIKLVTHYRPRLLVTPITLPFIIWVATVFVAAIFGNDPATSLAGMREEWLFLVFFVVWGGIQSDRDWKYVFTALIVSCTLSSLYAVWQHYTGLDLVHGVKLLKIISGYRVESTLAGYLTAGALFCLFSSFFLPRNLSSIGRWKISVGVVTILTSLAATLTYSRSAILGLASVYGVFIISSIRQFRWRAILAPVALVAVLLVIQPDVFFRFEKEGPGSETTKSYFDGTDKRWEIWGTAWNMFLDNPLTGVGHGQFEASYSHYSDDKSFPIQGHAHSDLLNIAASMGIVGLSAYLSLFILLGWKLHTCFRRNQNELIRSAALSGILVLISFIVMGLFEAFFMDEESRLTLIFLLGLSFVQIRLLSQPAEDVL